MICSLSVQREVADGHGPVGKFRPNHIRGCSWGQHWWHQHCWASGAKPLCNQAPVLIPGTRTHLFATLLDFSHSRGLIPAHQNDWEPWKASVIKETFKPGSNTWNFKEMLCVCRAAAIFLLPAPACRGSELALISPGDLAFYFNFLPPSSRWCFPLI